MLCVVIVLPVVYVLSFGPAAWLVQRSYIGVTANFVYWPVEWSCSHSELEECIIDWYE